MKNTRKDEKGSALIIVLAFLFLLTIVTIAFLSRSLLERQLSNASLNQNKIDLVAQGAAASIIADLQQEIVAGSTAAGNIYYPVNGTAMIPATVGFTHATPPTVDGLEDLLKVSQTGQAFHPYANASNRASAVDTTQASLNFRSVSRARWNKALLLAKKDPTQTDTTPVDAFPTPDWIYVARDGSNPTALAPENVSLPSISPTTTPGAGAGQNPITQRYAYAVYDEGSTLDMNVAGSPVPSNPTTANPTGGVTYTPLQPYKNALAYADFTPLLNPLGLSTTEQAAFLNGIVGWRNHASGAASGNFPGYTFSLPAAPQLNSFDAFIASMSTGFLSAGGDPTTQQSDNAFTSRQQLLQFLTNPSFLAAVGNDLTLAKVQTLFPYLGTFSRDVNQPSYVRLQSTNPASKTDYNASVPKLISYTKGGNNASPGAPNVNGSLDDKINPSFLGVTVQSAYPRNDGSTAVVGEPLVKKRFALNRLAWLTYLGPSATRTQYKFGDASPGTASQDYDMWALVNLYGISPALLAEGTTGNIQKYFGLTWNGSFQDPLCNATKFGAWQYNIHNGTGSGVGAIMRLTDIASMGTPHDPDFFELLKGAINVGSIAKPAIPPNTVLPPPVVTQTSLIPVTSLPASWQRQFDSNVDYQIMQIGANIITQSKVDGYPAHIVFYDGSSPVHVFAGVSNFPYLNYIFTGTIAGIAPSSNPPISSGDVPPSKNASNPLNATGLAALVQIPALWNPHDVASNGTSPVTVPSLRPGKFRIVVDSTYPDNIDPTGACSGYNYYYPLAHGYTAGMSPGPGSRGSDWTARVAPPDSPASSIDTFPPFTTGLIPARCLSYTSTALSFTDVNGTLFREPTILFRAGGQMGLTNASTSSLSNTWNMSTDFSIGLTSPLTNLNVNPLNILPAEGGTPVTDTGGGPFLGLYLGPVPLRFNISDSAGTTWTVTTSEVDYILRGSNIGLACAYFTYRLQYEYPAGSNNWITYDTKYGGPTVAGVDDIHYRINNPGSTGYTAIFNADNGSGAANANVAWATAIDPRTSHFGFLNGDPTRPDVFTTSSEHPGISLGWAQTHGWIDPTNGVMNTLRPDRDAGHYFYGNVNGGNDILHRTDNPTPRIDAGWIFPNYSYFGQTPFDFFVPGLLTQNNTDIEYIMGRSSGDPENAVWTSYYGTYAPVFYADPDGVVRRAMGAYVPATQNGPNFHSSDTTIGLPMARAQAYVNGSPPGSAPSESGSDPTSARYISQDPTYRLNQAQSRPLMLNRPFRSVAELGYVFSGTPWKNLDFSTPESGNGPLLDVFCIQDTDDSHSLVAGKVNLNTRQIPVLASIISGAYLDDPKVTNATVGSISPVGAAAPTPATTIATALVARTTNITNAAFGPLTNLADLVGKWVKGTPPNQTIAPISSPFITPGGPLLPLPATTLDGKNSYAGFSGIFISGTTTATPPATDLTSAYSQAFTGPLLQSITNIQRFHEAPLRALSATTQTRTWNLLIDVIAQAGRFPSTATSLDKFSVEGERRYWVHIAIDRLTGNIVDEQMEEVKE